MNRKLKNMLKNKYSAEPNKKYSFIRQLQSNPVWRKLHPISSTLRLSPAFGLIFATLAIIAVGTGIIAHNFREEEPPLPPDIPPVITETATATTSTLTTATATTSTATHSTITATATITTANQVTASTTARTSTATNTTASKTTVTAVNNTAPVNNSTKIQSSDTVNETTTTIVTTTPATSIYYTHLFSHDYKTAIEKAVETGIDESISLGYPDYNFSEDFVRLGFDVDDEKFGDATLADFTNLFMSIFTSYNGPTIVEGETTDIEYIAYEGKPWTICEITVSKAYDFEDLKNPINKGDKIKIAMQGGYMPVSEYIALNPDDTLFSEWTDEQINSTVIYEDGSNQNEPKIGDKYTYYLEKSELDIPVENLYMRVLADVTQFTTDGDKLIICNSHFSDYTTIDKHFVENEYYYYYDPNSDRCIAFLDHSFLLGGEFYCYSVDADEKLTCIGYGGADDGFFPFADYDYDEFKRIPAKITTETDEQGRTVLKAESFSITWTDTGAIIEYDNGTDAHIFDTLEVYYPK